MAEGSVRRALCWPFLSARSLGFDVPENALCLRHAAALFCAPGRTAHFLGMAEGTAVAHRPPETTVCLHTAGVLEWPSRIAFRTLAAPHDCVCMPRGIGAEESLAHEQRTTEGRNPLGAGRFPATPMPPAGATTVALHEGAWRCAGAAWPFLADGCSKKQWKRAKRLPSGALAR